MAAASETQENSNEKKQAEDTGIEIKENSKIKLEDLKVNDLKNELEKRDLDKNGVKSVLIERLKAAIIEEGENPEEYSFDVSPITNVCKSPVKKNVELIDTNGSVETNDEVSNNEEKQDIALQLSIDEEEAQLNEEENFIDIPKNPDSDMKLDDTEQLDSEIPKNEINKSSEVTADKPSTPPKAAKSQNGETKERKIVKTPLQIKNSDGISAVSPKVLKVIGKNDKLKSPNVLAKSLWITGLPNTTRAADLKALFSKKGKVLSVKIVKSAKQTPGKCYGFVTMATSKDATKAIQSFHRTELNGRIISVERTQSEPGTLLKKSESKILTLGAKKQTVKKEILASKQVANEKDSEKNKISETKDATKTEGKNLESTKLISEESGGKKEEKRSSKEKSKSKDRKPREHRERDGYRPVRRPVGLKSRSFVYNERSRYGSFRRPFGRRPFSSHVGFASSFRPRSNLLSVQKIRDERFQRERIREKREAERRRADELSRHRYIERKQREEAYRLEREKERLRIERELLERERAEILKLEREKQRLERERLEREREELRRQAELRRNSKRPYSRVNREPEPVWEERKKSRYDGRTSFHGDAPSSRFEFPPRERSSYSREYERHPDRYTSQKHIEVLPRSDFGDRDARREVTIRTRDERHIFSRGDFRDNRQGFSSRERERHSSRREAPRDEWKHERRVHERIISPSSSSGQRRMTYY